MSERFNHNPSIEEIREDGLRKTIKRQQKTEERKARSKGVTAGIMAGITALAAGAIAMGSHKAAETKAASSGERFTPSRTAPKNQTEASPAEEQKEVVEAIEREEEEEAAKKALREQLESDAQKEKEEFEIKADNKIPPKADQTGEQTKYFE